MMATECCETVQHSQSPLPFIEERHQVAAWLDCLTCPCQRTAALASFLSEAQAAVFFGTGVGVGGAGLGLLSHPKSD